MRRLAEQSVNSLIGMPSLHRPLSCFASRPGGINRFGIVQDSGKSLRYCNHSKIRYFSTSGRDYYEILGASKSDSEKDLKNKYRKLAKEYHPDTSKHSNASERFQEINEAWECLKDEKERDVYNRLGHQRYKTYKQTGSAHADHPGAGQGFAGQNMGMDINLEDLFGSMFGGQSTRQRGRASNPLQPTRGNNVHLKLDLTFDEAIRGCAKTLSYARKVKCGDCKSTGVEKGEKPKMHVCKVCNGTGYQQKMVNNMMFVQETCRACHGQGSKIENLCKTCAGAGLVDATETVKDIRIPEGVDNGMHLADPGRGDFGRVGGPPGDLILTISIRPHPTGKFTRRGLDIYTELDIPLVKSIIGGDVEIQNAFGKDLEINLPAGTMHKSTLRMANEGVRYGVQRGDQYVQVNVQPIKNLTEKQKELLKEFEEEEKRKKKD